MLGRTSLAAGLLRVLTERRGGRVCGSGGLGRREEAGLTSALGLSGPQKIIVADIIPFFFRKIIWPSCSTACEPQHLQIPNFPSSYVYRSSFPTFDLRHIPSRPARDDISDCCDRLVIQHQSVCMERGRKRTLSIWLPLNYIFYLCRHKRVVQDTRDKRWVSQPCATTPASTIASTLRPLCTLAFLRQSVLQHFSCATVVAATPRCEFR